MSDVETLVRDALTDDRRRVPPPHDASGWVRAAARRQRRRNAVVGAVAVSLLAAAAAGVLVPRLVDTEASYVAGRPDADSTLLPWAPVGSLVDDPEAVASALDAWEQQADDEPVGDVHLLGGDASDVAAFALLQATTDSGSSTAALLTLTDRDGPWRLLDTVDLNVEGEVEAVFMPGDVELGWRPALLLGPTWRIAGLRRVDSAVGWQLLPSGPSVDEASEWLPISRTPGLPWWAPLRLSQEGLPPTTVVLDRDRGGPSSSAPVLELPAAGALTLLERSELSFRLLRGERAAPEALEPAREVTRELGLEGPVRVTVLGVSSGALSMGRSSAAFRAPTATMFAQFQAPELERPQLVAYATTGSEVTCFSRRSVPANDVTSLPFVGMGCPARVTGSGSGKAQGNLLMTRSFRNEPELKTPVLDISVTIERANGSSTTHDLPDDGSGLFVTEDTTAPVNRYVFNATETIDGAELEPWVWPGWGRYDP